MFVIIHISAAPLRSLLVATISKQRLPVYYLCLAVGNVSEVERDYLELSVGSGIIQRPGESFLSSRCLLPTYSWLEHPFPILPDYLFCEVILGSRRHAPVDKNRSMPWELGGTWWDAIPYTLSKHTYWLTFRSLLPICARLQAGWGFNFGANISCKLPPTSLRSRAKNFFWYLWCGYRTVIRVGTGPIATNAAHLSASTTHTPHPHAHPSGPPLTITCTILVHHPFISSFKLSRG